jgi:hypothetical protein
MKAIVSLIADVGIQLSGGRADNDWTSAGSE